MVTHAEKWNAALPRSRSSDTIAIDFMANCPTEDSPHERAADSHPALLLARCAGLCDAGDGGAASGLSGELFRAREHLRSAGYDQRSAATRDLPGVQAEDRLRLQDRVCH